MGENLKSLIYVAVVACVMVTLPIGCSSSVPESGLVVKLNDYNFDEQISSGVVLVDFWAPWCSPCVAQGPIVEQVAVQFEGQAKVAKLNVDSAAGVAQKFSIKNIPTFIIFKDGKQVDRFSGMMDAETLASAIDFAINSDQ